MKEITSGDRNKTAAKRTARRVQRRKGPRRGLLADDPFASVSPFGPVTSLVSVVSVAALSFIMTAHYSHSGFKTKKYTPHLCPAFILARVALKQNL
jgi:hypothetical protein